MNHQCETVIISDKAYNAIIRESFAKHPVETGGILLGYILDNGLWVVMEMIPPGINGVFQTSYFEYDQDFVNYLGTSIANQYKEPLQVLGLWHRHPGSMDFFSSTDDGTNADFASKNPYGIISGLVNIDPSFRLTMYHLAHNDGVRPRNVAYTTVDVEVGDDLIPEKFFSLRYIDGDRSNLHPSPTNSNTHVAKTRNVPKSQRNEGEEFDEDKSEEAKFLKDERVNGIVSMRSWFTSTRGYVVGTILIFLTGMVVGGIVTPKISNFVRTHYSHKNSASGVVNRATTSRASDKNETAPHNNNNKGARQSKPANTNNTSRQDNHDNRH